MERVQKACPVVLRHAGGALQILAFRHPQEGKQLVKGTVEPGEATDTAALRELLEKSGLTASLIEPLGSLPMPGSAEDWHFALCQPSTQPAESWRHWTSDGGGLEFAFFWHPLDQKPDGEWHPVFHYALAFIRGHGSIRRASP
jgi:8-oxo-dGTP pyrophosphatase MutT (NUDIX family)